MVHTKGNQNPSDFFSTHTRSWITWRNGRGLCQFSHHSCNTKCHVSCRDSGSNKSRPHFAKSHWDDLYRSVGSSRAEGVDQVELQLFWKVKGELAVNKDTDIILQRNRVVLPTSLRQRAISIAHEGHQGLVKTKKLLREKVWFPGIDKEVMVMIDQCVMCQASGPENHPKPLQMSPLPPEPWHTVNVDFGGPFPTGECIFVVIDAYSHFPEVEIMHSMTAQSTILKMELIFATHEIPQVVQSDNGPPFSNEEVRTYMEKKGIEHRRITPLWPPANFEAENFMKPLNKAILTAHAEGRDWRKHLYQFLLNDQATPHSTTDFVPSELLFNHKINQNFLRLKWQRILMWT